MAQTNSLKSQQSQAVFYSKYYSLTHWGGLEGNSQDGKDSQQEGDMGNKGTQGCISAERRIFFTSLTSLHCRVSAALGLFCVLPSGGGTRDDHKELGGTLLPSLFLTKLFKDRRLPGEASGRG